MQVFVPREGTACLECTWGAADYRLAGCQLRFVSHPGAGFEAAAAQLLPAFVADPTAPDGGSVAGARIYVQLLLQKTGAGPLTISPPH